MYNPNSTENYDNIGYWDYDAMYEIPIEEGEDTTPLYGSIAYLIDGAEKGGN